MTKRLALTLTTLALVSVAAVGSASSGQADLSFDRDAHAFRYYTAKADSVDINMTPNTPFNPILLPCDVTRFGGQFDLRSAPASQTAFPVVNLALFTKAGQPVTSQGFPNPQNPNSFSSIDMNCSAIAPGATQQDGYTTVDSTGPFRDWAFQPSDLAADQLVRMHVAVRSYADAALSQPLVDATPADNAFDVWVKRECSCR